MAESSLYERLGGAFAIAAVIDRCSDAVVRNPIAGQQSENPELRNGAPTIWPGFQVSNSCAPYGSATLPAAPSDTQPRNRAVLLSAWKKPTAR
jgi:hypothetical protein